MGKPKGTELEFLRFFYNSVGEYLGGTKEDVFNIIKRTYKEIMKEELPEDYEL